MSSMSRVQSFRFFRLSRAVLSAWLLVASAAAFAQATPDLGAEKLLKRAAKLAKEQVDAEAEELKRAIDEEIA